MRLFLKHSNLLLFSIFQIVFSGPGQTFLIALVVIPIFSEMTISMTKFAGIYSLATFAASLCLNPAGCFLDKWSVNRIILINSLLMALGCILLATSTGIISLFISFVLLRFIGQGVFGLTASTILINAFEKNRGQAMGIMTLGFSISEMIYPTITLILLGGIGWRYTYIVFAISYIAIMLPLQFFLIKRSNLKKGQYLPGEMSIQPQSPPASFINRENKDSLSVIEVIKTPTFYLITIANCVPPLLMTGLFFHQDTVFHTNHWPLSSIALGIMVYAVSKAIASVIMGPIVDRHGPLWPFVTTILLLSGGTLIAAIGGTTILIYVYFSMMGSALGFSSSVMNVIYPNLYGVKHIGAIKGLMATFRNGLTAFAPLPIAMVLDSGGSLSGLLFYTSLGVMVLATFPIIANKIDPKLNRKVNTV